MEVILFLGLVGFVFFLMMNYSINSNKETEIHNAKVSLKNTYYDVYKHEHTKSLMKILLEIEVEYINLVDLGFKRYRDQFKDTKNTNGAMFLGFERVFSIEEFRLISRYEAIVEILNSRRDRVDRIKTKYSETYDLLEGIYGLNY